MRNEARIHNPPVHNFSRSTIAMPQKRPNKKSDYLDRGPRMLMTGGTYALTNYKRIYVNREKGADGYAGDSGVHIGMIYPQPDGEDAVYYHSTVSNLSVIPRELVIAKSTPSDFFVNQRDKESRKALVGMGTSAKVLAKWAKKHQFTKSNMKLVFKYVHFRMFAHFFDLLEDVADDNSDAGVELVQQTTGSGDNSDNSDNSN